MPLINIDKPYFVVYIEDNIEMNSPEMFATLEEATAEPPDGYNPTYDAAFVCKINEDGRVTVEHVFGDLGYLEGEEEDEE